MTTSPRVVFGVPVYNHASKLPEALESILGQQDRSLAIVVIDDASTDETSRIVQEYAAIDSRISYERNPTRLGYIRNANRAFRRARELYPHAPYFAWGSDHDVWHPRWLRSLAQALDTNPRAVLAYPWHLRISGENEVLHERRVTFETRGVRAPWERLRRVLWNISAGNATMGLYRADAVERVGALQPVVGADRLLMAELSLIGEFVCVPEVLWHRRYAGLASPQRQIAASFPGAVPAYLRRHWSWQHAGNLGYRLAIRGSARPDVGRALAVFVSLTYVGTEFTRRLARVGRIARKRVSRPAWRDDRKIGAAGQ